MATTPIEVFFEWIHGNLLYLLIHILNYGNPTEADIVEFIKDRTEEQFKHRPPAFIASVPTRINLSKPGNSLVIESRELQFVVPLQRVDNDKVLVRMANDLRDKDLDTFWFNDWLRVSQADHRELGINRTSAGGMPRADLNQLLTVEKPNSRYPYHKDDGDTNTKLIEAVGGNEEEPNVFLLSLNQLLYIPDLEKLNLPPFNSGNSISLHHMFTHIPEYDADKFKNHMKILGFNDAGDPIYIWYLHMVDKYYRKVFAIKDFDKKPEYMQYIDLRVNHNHLRAKYYYKCPINVRGVQSHDTSHIDSLIFALFASKIDAIMDLFTSKKATQNIIGKALGIKSNELLMNADYIQGEDITLEKIRFTYLNDTKTPGSVLDTLMNMFQPDGYFKLDKYQTNVILNITNKFGFNHEGGIINEPFYELKVEDGFEGPISDLIKYNTNIYINGPILNVDLLLKKKFIVHEIHTEIFHPKNLAIFVLDKPGKVIPEAFIQMHGATYELRSIVFKKHHEYQSLVKCDDITWLHYHNVVAISDVFEDNEIDLDNVIALVKGKIELMIYVNVKYEPDPDLVEDIETGTVAESPLGNPPPLASGIISERLDEHSAIADASLLVTPRVRQRRQFSDDLSDDLSIDEISIDDSSIDEISIDEISIDDIKDDDHEDFVDIYGEYDNTVSQHSPEKYIKDNFFERLFNMAGSSREDKMKKYTNERFGLFRNLAQRTGSDKVLQSRLTDKISDFENKISQQFAIRPQIQMVDALRETYATILVTGPQND